MSTSFHIIECFVKSSCQEISGNMSFSTKRWPANSECDWAPTACLGVFFFFYCFWSGEIKYQTRLLLWSAGSPEHSSYRQFFPSCRSRQGREQTSFCQWRIFHWGTRWAKQALICAQCGGAAFLLVSGGVTLGIFEAGMSLECVRKFGAPGVKKPPQGAF